MTDLIASLAGLALQASGALGGAPEQEHLFQARQMQALSLGWHIVIVCFGVAFPAIVLFMEALHLRTGDPLYRVIAKRWSKAMLVLFAVGVVSGTILSFELGMLWPEFMATFGDVFGLGFALEGFSFFVEAIFIAIYVYGWDRLPAWVHFLTGIPVAIAGVTGSMFVLMVNGWMNAPTGFSLEDGRVTDVRPVDALLNDHVWHELVHMLLAGYMVAGFCVAGVYAWGLLRGRRDRYHRVAFLVPFTVAALASPAQVVVGDWAARQVGETQPVKLAAFEGLGSTQAGASLHLGGWYRDGEVIGGIELPRMLSLLAAHDPDAVVAGLDSVPPDERPPVNVVRLAFQAMVGIGSALALLGVLFVVAWWRRRGPPASPWFHRAAVLAGPAAVVALICGWIVTEVGRQPWIVYRVMRVEEAVTAADGIPVGYGFVAAVYAALSAVAVWMLRRVARAPLDEEVEGASTLPRRPA
ncbi:cytochrome ubiquinol oxidase subunit I [Miltoncostaea marina]|uniref:cytochrome ubiquinol oxidase subunit I n=1 Tax=Miltoncostaea marina TaxID=2843215 RepID=UPI001C3DB252|nr:cytochrome ubiquinol oxidase subunit I [Miltoncostaea marina]